MSSISNAIVVLSSAVGITLLFRRASLHQEQDANYEDKVQLSYSSPKWCHSNGHQDAKIYEDNVLLSYSSPKWCHSNGISKLQVPLHRLRLGHLPTPIHHWKIQQQEQQQQQRVQYYIKRDDYTGSELSGNKVRKLDFLLAAALHQKCDSVITVGGIQSNHCRATAVAAARIGLKSHLILRTTTGSSSDPGFVGNLLVSRMVGAHLHLVTTEEYVKIGGLGLVQNLQKELELVGEKPYSFPSGGSCTLGLWGYIDCVQEIIDSNITFDRIYFACGSGGTAAGLALGMYLSGLSISSGGTTELIAISVDDTPEFFYDKIDSLIASTGIQNIPKSSRCLLRIIDGIGIGYANSTDEELKEIYHISQNSGVVLDPVYSGKAALGMLKDVQKNEAPGNLKILFIHTGGLLGFYDKIDQLGKVMIEQDKEKK